MKIWFEFLTVGLLAVFTVFGWQINDVSASEEKNRSAQAGTSVLTAKALLAAVEDENTIVVDTRQSDAFNGWDLNKNGLGGHIKGAVDFSYNWLSAEDSLLKKILKTKGLSTEKKIILYNDIRGNNEAVRNYLKKNGFKQLELYNLNNWLSEKGTKLVKYKNYHLIVPAQVVNGLLKGEAQETFDTTNVKIVEASWGEAKASYAKGHVPTAFHINTDSVEPPPSWMLADEETLRKFALAHGFTHSDTVIVTGEEQMAAYRVALVLRYMGVQDVRVLNGGTTAWVDAGYELETTKNLPTPVKAFGVEIPAKPDFIETIEELKVSLKNPKFTLVDNRTWLEHIGKSTGYTYHDKAGRIPGSVYGYAGIENSFAMDYFRNPDKTMKRPEEFIALWEKQGIDITNRLAFMCGSGWRAAEIYYYADVYGLKDITLYSDGWIGWSNQPQNQVETGDPK
ncbi:MAG: thiosulfate sulfurtransferase [Proteobacteria bacterium]|nr:thiosulfate sulfurtransferase [Pseudomonadota bacterium]